MTDSSRLTVDKMAPWAPCVAVPGHDGAGVVSWRFASPRVRRLSWTGTELGGNGHHDAAPTLCCFTRTRCPLEPWTKRGASRAPIARRTPDLGVHRDERMPRLETSRPQNGLRTLRACADATGRAEDQSWTLCAVIVHAPNRTSRGVGRTIGLIGAAHSCVSTRRQWTRSKGREQCAQLTAFFPRESMRSVRFQAKTAGLKKHVG